MNSKILSIFIIIVISCKEKINVNMLDVLSHSHGKG